MAKRKKSSRRPQRKQKKNHQGSRHDKRRRLEIQNPLRRITLRAIVPLIGALGALVGTLQSVMDRRIAFRLAIIVSGMLLADDRRTASAWFAAGGVTDDWDRFYDCLISIGRRSEPLTEAVLKRIVQQIDPGPNGRIVLGVDDTPTPRYGKQVEGAGVHHNPTAGPADGEFLYGHNWVSLAYLATHPIGGVIALPLRSLLYVREVDTPALDAKYGWTFRTKHQLAVELVLWCVATLRSHERGHIQSPEHLQARPVHLSVLWCSRMVTDFTEKKSTAHRVFWWRSRKFSHLSDVRSGAGTIPSSLRMFRTVWRLMPLIPSLRISPIIRVYPKPVSLAISNTSSRISRGFR